MGNCSLKGVTGECHHSIRVLSDSGAVLLFKAPKTVGQVLQSYPGYGVFRQGHASSPLPEHESLSYGLFYYLLPLKEGQEDKNASCHNNGVSEKMQVKGLLQRSEAESMSENDHEQEQPNAPRRLAAASDYVQNLPNGSALEVLPSARNGVWKVKLVIDTRQLEEILSEQVNTEALIEKMRVAATTACSTSPARSRTMSTRKVGLGWKPTLFSNSGKFSKTVAAESN